MAIFTRMTRLLKADFNAVLDHLEEPQAILNQAIREMQEIIDEVALRIKDAESRLAGLSRRKGQLSERHSSAKSQIDLAFEAGDQALAKRLFERNLELEKSCQWLDLQASDAQENLIRLTEAAQDYRDRLAVIMAKSAILRHDRNCEPSGAIPTDPPLRATADEVEVAWLTELKRRNLKSDTGGKV